MLTSTSAFLDYMVVSLIISLLYSSESGAAGSMDILDNVAYGTSHINPTEYESLDQPCHTLSQNKATQEEIRW